MIAFVVVEHSGYHRVPTRLSRYTALLNCVIMSWAGGGSHLLGMERGASSVGAVVTSNSTYTNHNTPEVDCTLFVGVHSFFTCQFAVYSFFTFREHSRNRCSPLIVDDISAAS